MKQMQEKFSPAASAATKEAPEIKSQSMKKELQQIKSTDGKDLESDSSLAL
jgi:hypothetical protein